MLPRDESSCSCCEGLDGSHELANPSDEELERAEHYLLRNFPHKDTQSILLAAARAGRQLADLEVRTVANGNDEKAAWLDCSCNSLGIPTLSMQEETEVEERERDAWRDGCANWWHCLPSNVPSYRDHSVEHCAVCMCPRVCARYVCEKPVHVYVIGWSGSRLPPRTPATRVTQKTAEPEGRKPNSANGASDG